MVERMARECLSVRVRLINRVVTGLYDRALRPFGMRVSQVNILVAVAHGGSARPADVCRALRLEKSTLSRDVELMKGRGWLESDPPAGGRNQVLRITPRGLELLDQMEPAWHEVQAEARRLVGEADVDALRRIADRLRLGGPD